MKKYKLKDEKYRRLAQQIANFSAGGSISLEDYVSRERSAMRDSLKEYGVFELWFEEVQEPAFKSGDYIYVARTMNVYEIENCEVIGEELHWNIPEADRGELEYRFSTYLSSIRHATAEEIEEYNRQLPLIRGYKGVQEGDYIVYGCQRVHVQDFRKLYEACLYTNVTSITIAGKKIQMETLQKIYEKTH